MKNSPSQNLSFWALVRIFLEVIKLRLITENILSCWNGNYWIVSKNNTSGLLRAASRISGKISRGKSVEKILTTGNFINKNYPVQTGWENSGELDQMLKKYCTAPARVCSEDINLYLTVNLISHFFSIIPIYLTYKSNFCIHVHF